MLFWRSELPIWKYSTEEPNSTGPVHPIHLGVCSSFSWQIDRFKVWIKQWMWYSSKSIIIQILPTPETPVKLFSERPEKLRMSFENFQIVQIFSENPDKISFSKKVFGLEGCFLQKKFINCLTHSYGGSSTSKLNASIWALLVVTTGKLLVASLTSQTISKFQWGRRKHV